MSGFELQLRLSVRFEVEYGHILWRIWFNVNYFPTIVSTCAAISSLFDSKSHLIL